MKFILLMWFRDIMFCIILPDKFVDFVPCIWMNRSLHTKGNSWKRIFPIQIGCVYVYGHCIIRIHINCVDENQNHANEGRDEDAQPVNATNCSS